MSAMSNRKARTGVRFQLIFFSVAVAAAAAGGEGVSTPFLAKRDQTQEAAQLTSVTAVLNVKNDASSTVHLMSCMENSSSVTVEPGKTKTMTLSGLTGMWVVPDGAMLDCEKGPFQFFYVATDVNLSSGTLGAFVGFGVEMREEDDRNSTASGESKDYAALLEAEEKEPLDLHGLTGLRLTAGADAISCTQNFCEADFPVSVSAPPRRLDLVIKGSSEPEAPAYLNLWYWRRRGWGYGGYGGYGYRRGGWGWGRRYWGYGRPWGWYR